MHKLSVKDIDLHIAPADIERNPNNPRTIAPAIVQRSATGDDFTCIAGYRRLQAALDTFGQAAVQVAETGEILQVRKVDGKLIVVG